MRTYNQQTQTNVLLNTNINGPAMPLKNTVMFSVAANITGTPTGSVKLQASNDPETNDTQTPSATIPGNAPLSPPAVGPTHWADIASTSTNVTTSGTTLWNIVDVGYNYVRVVYTDTSSGASTARLAVVINSKGV